MEAYYKKYQITCGYCQQTETCYGHFPMDDEVKICGECLNYYREDDDKPSVCFDTDYDA